MRDLHPYLLICSIVLENVNWQEAPPFKIGWWNEPEERAICVPSWCGLPGPLSAGLQLLLHRFRVLSCGNERLQDQDPYFSDFSGYSKGGRVWVLQQEFCQTDVLAANHYICNLNEQWLLHIACSIRYQRCVAQQNGIIARAFPCILCHITPK